MFGDLVSGPGGCIPGPGERFLRRVFDPRTKNIYIYIYIYIYILESPKVAYGMCFVAVLVSTIFTSLAAPRRCHSAKIKCGRCPLFAFVMGCVGFGPLSISAFFCLGRSWVDLIWKG